MVSFRNSPCYLRLSNLKFFWTKFLFCRRTRVSRPLAGEPQRLERRFATGIPAAMLLPADQGTPTIKAGLAIFYCNFGRFFHDAAGISAFAPFRSLILSVPILTLNSKCTVPVFSSCVTFFTFFIWNPICTVRY
jgi:hypothetical protein